MVSATLTAITENATRIRSPLFRSYGGILPSSFTTIISIALVFSTQPPESVWGTGGLHTRSRRFSRQHRITHSMGRIPPSHHVSDTVGRGFAYTPSYTLSPGQPSPGMSYLPASLRSLPPRVRIEESTTTNPKVNNGLPFLASPNLARARTRRYGNINPLSIDYACRPRLRSRLTQGRLA